MNAKATTLRGPALGHCKGGKMRLLQPLIAQFGRPTGFWGNLAGMIKAYRPSNRQRNDWTIALLDIQPQDRVLEIGFGPGVAIERVSKIALEGFVAGIDHSETMLRQARKRNVVAIQQGRVDLQLASVSNPPVFDPPFDKIFATNSFQFWPDPVVNLKQLRRLLKPGGRIAITFQPRNPGATDEDAQRAGQVMVKDLERAGFSPVRLETKQMKSVSVVCALGVKAESSSRR